MKKKETKYYWHHISHNVVHMSQGPYNMAKINPCSLIILPFPIKIPQDPEIDYQFQQGVYLTAH